MRYADPMIDTEGNVVPCSVFGCIQAADNNYFDRVLCLVHGSESDDEEQAAVMVTRHKEERHDRHHEGR